MVESEAEPNAQAIASERDRIGAALVDLVLERGYEETTREAVCERAAVPLSAFETHFADLQDCLIQVYVGINEGFDQRVQAAYAAHEAWPDAIRAAAYAAADFLDENPREARFNTIAVLSAGELVMAHRDVYMQQLVDLIDAGRRELDDPESLGRSVAVSVVGAIFERLLREVSRGGGELRARDVVPELLYIAVRPYLGREEAAKELRKHGRTESETPTQLSASGRYGPGVNTGDPSRPEPAPGLPRLPPGRHGLSRDFVVQNQRDRITAGIISSVAERGYHGTTVSDIAAASGVSRRTFYAYFSSKEECYLATYDVIASHLAEASRGAGAGEEKWPARVRAKLAASLDFFAANPDLVRFYLSAPPRAGEAIAARYRLGAARVLQDLTEGLPSGVREPSPAVQSALAGGMAALIVAKVEGGEGDRLGELVPDMTELFLTPYLGREVAVEVARRPS